jgi:acetyl esterase/lipase
MPGISYYLVMLVLKIKGVKKSFSKSPIDYKKLRKEDMPVPGKNLLSGNSTSTFKIRNTTITELSPTTGSATDFLIIYCHGGAFVYGPTDLNWKALDQISKSTRTKAWMVNYPKAPETKIQEIALNIDEVYDQAIKSYDPSKIILIGDSVGGNLIISLMQRLIDAGKDHPKKIIAISPVMDASLSNPEIDQIDKKDPMLSKSGVLSSKMMCAGDLDLKTPLISPLYGSFKGFPETHLFIAGKDIMMPDTRLAVQKMMRENVSVEVIEGKYMPHIWPLLPVLKEAKTAMAKIVEIIGSFINSKGKKSAPLVEI